ncbi:MAG: arginase [Planctomycetes bacterium]|nr:arginase [Planctomycetota bacterium]
MRKVAIVGVPLDLGGNRRGVDMGPSAVRVAGITDAIRRLGFDVRDTGDVDVPLPEEAEIGDAKKKYAEDIEDVCQDVCERVVREMKDGRVPITLGGDHSIAMGSIAGVATHFRAESRRIGLIWFDAHGDMNTPESTNTGNVHGMPLAHVLGMGDPLLAGVGGFSPKVHYSNAVLFGVRDLDEREKKLIGDSGVRVFTMKDLDRRGVSTTMEEAIEIASRGTAGIHVSFDMDAIDPSVARGVGTPRKGGLTYRESHLCLEIISDSQKMVGMDLVEVNPILDTRNATAELGVELILSALGKQIY